MAHACAGAAATMVRVWTAFSIEVVQSSLGLCVDDAGAPPGKAESTYIPETIAATMTPLPAILPNRQVLRVPTSLHLHSGVRLRLLHFLCCGMGAEVFNFCWG